MNTVAARLDTATPIEEKWESVGPEEHVLEASQDGKFVTTFLCRAIFHGAIVRKRGGKWMKRVSPTVSLNGQGVNLDQYVLGKDLA